MEKPILFNTEMVQAILDGRKTVTRRIVKTQPLQQIPLGFVIDSTEKSREGCFGWGKDKYGGIIDYARPSYNTGDVLYVRETWCKAETDVKPNDDFENIDCKYIFKVDDNGKKHPLVDINVKRWRPSIHMPKEAARIFLEVTDVRVERLQDITTEGCFAEGITYDYNSKENEFDIFAELWNSTIKKNDLDIYSWNINPWVWVIEFKKVDR